MPTTPEASSMLPNRWRLTPSPTPPVADQNLDQRSCTIWLQRCGHRYHLQKQRRSLRVRKPPWKFNAGNRRKGSCTDHEQQTQNGLREDPPRDSSRLQSIQKHSWDDLHLTLATEKMSWTTTAVHGLHRPIQSVRLRLKRTPLGIPLQIRLPGEIYPHPETPLRWHACHGQDQRRQLGTIQSDIRNEARLRHWVYPLHHLYRNDPAYHQGRPTTRDRNLLQDGRQQSCCTRWEPPPVNPYRFPSRVHEVGTEHRRQENSSRLPTTTQGKDSQFASDTTWWNNFRKRGPLLLPREPSFCQCRSSWRNPTSSEMCRKHLWSPAWKSLLRAWHQNWHKNNGLQGCRDPNATIGIRNMDSIPSPPQNAGKLPLTLSPDHPEDQLGRSKNQRQRPARSQLNQHRSLHHQEPTKMERPSKLKIASQNKSSTPNSKKANG